MDPEGWGWQWRGRVPAELAETIAGGPAGRLVAARARAASAVLRRRRRRRCQIAAGFWQRTGSGYGRR